MFITAVCVIFLNKLRWPKIKSLYVGLTCCKQGWVASRLSYRRVGYFVVWKCFSLLLLFVFWNYSNSKQKRKRYTENLAVKFKTQIKILAYPRLTLLGSERPGQEPRF